MKATSKSPANIAFIKYWGKKNAEFRIPLNNSLSMNLSNIFTLTTVEFSPRFKKDVVKLSEGEFSEKEKERVLKHIDRIRDIAKLDQKVEVMTKNNFPKGTGIASSASGFSALTVAASKAAGLNLTPKELSILARLGSGSACRSIPDGFVEWKAGKNHLNSYAYSIYPSDYWNICDLVVLIDSGEKKVGSTKGHRLAEESPFLESRIGLVGSRLKLVKRAIKNRDFTTFGENIEAEALNMHAVMMTSNPPIIYWLPKTLEIMLAIQFWREKGLEGYFTIDAGPIVHLICQRKNVNEFKTKFSEIEGINDIIVNYPADGASLIDEHLF